MLGYIFTVQGLNKGVGGVGGGFWLNILFKWKILNYNIYIIVYMLGEFIDEKRWWKSLDERVYKGFGCSGRQKGVEKGC